MSKELKKECLPKLQARYSRRNREGKSRMLDELCADYQYDRKYAIKLLSSSFAAARGKAHPGPERRYDEIEPVVQYIWLQAEQPCGKRLVPILRQWLPYYERRFETLSRRHRKLVSQISAATLDRLLAPARAKHVGRGRCGTKPGSLLRSEIPIRTGTWDLSQPGYLEADSVAHCGGSLAGDFIWSLTYTDILSGWTEGGAVWNKGAAGVLAATRQVEERLPFALLGFDSDNGGEFLNHHLWSYMRERQEPVEFTRSRPYHSDDNAHVEQKNWSAVRQLLGYERLDNPEVIALLNDLYENEWHWYVNYFCPTFKLLEKKKVGSKYVKRYEKPRTPYARLLESAEVTAAHKENLRAIRSGLDPVKLRRRIEQKLRRIFALNKQECLRVATAGAPS